MAADMAHWGFMREWWRVLQLSALLQVITKLRRGSQQFGYRAMAINAPEEAPHSKSRWIQQRDALELVFLQLKADRHAFMEMAREFCVPEGGSGIVWGEFHPDEFIPCLTELLMENLDVDCDDPAWECWLLSTLLEAVPLSERSKRFRATRAKILGMVEGPIRVLCEQFTIPVTVVVWISSAEVLGAVLEKLIKLRTAADEILTKAETDPKEEKRRAALRVYPFRIANLDLSVSELKVTLAIQAAIDQIVKTPGLQLRNLEYSSWHKHTRTAFGELVRTLVMGPSRSPVAATLDLSYDVLNPENPTLMAAQLVQVLSALLVPSRFNSVNIRGVIDSYNASDRRWAWLWLVHAFFSSSAAHSIDCFRLTVNTVTSYDLDAVQEYLRARNPVALLCHPSWRFVGTADPATQPRKRVSLAKSTTLLLNPFRRRSPQSVPLAAAGWYDVIQEDLEYVDVVVPAYGQCRVAKTEAIDWQIGPDTGPQATFASHGIKSLVVWIRDDSFDGEGNPQRAQVESANLSTLLEIVGQPLEELDVSSSTSLSQAFLDSVWLNCPKLRVLLSSHVYFRSFQYLIDAFETGRCQVRSLEFSRCSVLDGDSLIPFIDALIDPRTKLASQLQEFAFSEDPGDFFLRNDDFREFAVMLSNNKTLRYFAMNVDPLDVPTHSPQLGPQDGVILAGQSEPMPIQSTCALISVVELANSSANTTTIPTSALIGQLDSGILSTILAFCAHPVTRSVVLKGD